MMAADQAANGAMTLAPRVSLFPAIVNVEVLRGRCPCRCVHCPVGLVSPSARRHHFGFQTMEFSLFQRIADEIAEHPSTVLRIHSTGEPLLWRHLPQAATYLREQAVRSWLFTCGVTTDKDLLRSIMEDLDIVEVSIDAVNAGDYRATKGVNAFDRVKRNLDYMACCSPDARRARLLVSRVGSADAERDQAFIDYWRSTGLVDDAFVRSRHSYNRLLDRTPIDATPEASPCLVHWARFNIALDGTAVVCFNELFKQTLDPSVRLGSTFEESIAQIWHGSRLHEVRRVNLTGAYDPAGWSGQLPCRTCTECQPLNGVPGRRTSEHQVGQLGGRYDPLLS